jgi:MFS transporter, DHA1 family, multidrug resistance protein
MGPIIGGYAAEYFGLRAPFFVMSGLMVIAGLWAYFRIPETRPSHSDGQQERTPVQRQAHAPLTMSSMKSLLLNANFVMVSLVTLLTFFTRTGAQNQILPLLSHDRMGLSESQIGLALTLSMIMQLVIIIVGRRSSDRFGRKAVITPGCIIIVIALVMLSQSYFYWFLLLTCIFMGIGVGIVGSTVSAYVSDIIPRGNYGSGMGLCRAASDIGFVIGPVLLASWLISGVTVLLSGLMPDWCLWGLLCFK